jgi:MFS transporter, YNFM family, putative membrane transport protein
VASTPDYFVNAPPAPSSTTRAIAFLALASVASQAMVRAVDTLLPQIADDIGTTVGQAAVVVTAYAIMHGTVQLIIGPIGDRLGKYRLVATACALSAVMVALCGLAQSLTTLAIARLASGATAAWIIPLGMAYVADVVPYERRQQVLGRFLTGQISGQMFGQAAAGVLGDYFGWRNVFFFLAGVFAVAAIALFYELAVNPLTRDCERISDKPSNPFADYAALFSNRWARFVLLIVCFEGMLVFGIFTYVGADLHLRFGLGFTAIGLIVGAFGIGGIVYALIVTPLMERLGQVGIARVGSWLMAAAFLVLAVEPIWLPAPFAVATIGMGFYMLHNTLQTVGSQMAPEVRGTAVAIFASVYYVGQTISVTLAAPVVDHFGAPPLFVGSAMLLPILAWWFTRRLKER